MTFDIIISDWRLDGGLAGLICDFWHHYFRMEVGWWTDWCDLWPLTSIFQAGSWMVDWLMWSWTEFRVKHWLGTAVWSVMCPSDGQTRTCLLSVWSAINDRTFFHIFSINYRHNCLPSFRAAYVCQPKVVSPADGVNNLHSGFWWLALGWYCLTIMCLWSLMSYSGNEARVWPRQPT